MSASSLCLNQSLSYLDYFLDLDSSVGGSWRLPECSSRQVLSPLEPSSGTTNWPWTVYMEEIIPSKGICGFLFLVERSCKGDGTNRIKCSPYNSFGRRFGGNQNDSKSELLYGNSL